jgi:hypothetical protein
MSGFEATGTPRTVPAKRGRFLMDTQARFDFANAVRVLVAVEKRYIPAAYLDAPARVEPRGCRSSERDQSRVAG